MARISKNPLDDKTYRQILNTLDFVLGKSKKDEVRHVLFSLLGRSERIMVTKRFTATLLLKQGYRTSEIARLLKMTEATVRKLNKVRSIKNKGFDLAFEKIKGEKIANEVREILAVLVKNSAELFLKYKVKPPNDNPKVK